MKLSVVLTLLFLNSLTSLVQANEGFSPDLEGRFLLAKNSLEKQPERVLSQCPSVVEITLYNENKTLILEKYKKFYGIQEEAIHYENTECGLNAQNLKAGETRVCKTSTSRAHKVEAYNLSGKMPLVSSGAVEVVLSNMNNNVLTISRSSSVRALSLNKITNDEVKCRYIRSN